MLLDCDEVMGDGDPVYRFRAYAGIGGECSPDGTLIWCDGEETAGELRRRHGADEIVCCESLRGERKYREWLGTTAALAAG